MRLFGLTLLCMTLFASNSVFCRAALVEYGMDPGQYTAVRGLSAAATLCLLGWWHVRQHSKGEAADIYGPSTESRLREWYDWIKDNCDFDQLIWETSKTTGNKWIHVSCCLDTHKNRKSAFSLVQ